uniref:hypothetical protein n=1 Tax=Thaumasiovibrio occultus TaxID=1891184 RepID=UPI000B35F880|nr:hypothetical protein [Thaumasiovibrio occultus]
MSTAAIKQIIEGFIEHFVPLADKVIFALALQPHPRVSHLACIKDRVVDDVAIRPEMEQHLALLAQIQYQTLLAESNDGSVPLAVYIGASQHSQSTRYVYREAQYRSIAKADVGMACSYYDDRQVILPDAITEQRKQAFAGNKAIDSVWRLEQFGKTSRQLSSHSADTEVTSAQAWLQQPSQAIQTIETVKMSGLQLIFYRDGSFYDEAIDKGLNIDWINDDGELDAYHSSICGQQHAWQQQTFLLLTDQDIGEPPYLRYDDGDTLVADVCVVVGDQLYRTVNVVTDGVYLDRFVYVYQRQSLPEPALND